jgi:hypothetical protein
MKTTAFLTALAIGAVIAVAGLAVASGSTATTLGTQDRTGTHQRMMDQDGTCDGSGNGQGMAKFQFQNQTQSQAGSQNQCQYEYQQLDGSCSGQCSEPNYWNYSWDHCNSA